MLPKTKRLVAQDYKGIKTRIVYRGPYFDIATSPANVTKYACIIAKKRIRKAVERNKIKRKIYTVIQKVEVSSPKYIFIYPTKQALTAPISSIKDECAKAFDTL